MGNQKHTGVSAASARNHYGQAGQVQDSAFHLVGSVAGADTITGSLSPTPTAYANGMKVVLVPASNNTGAATLGLNGLTGRSIVDLAGSALPADTLVAGIPVTLVYDLSNTRWVLQKFGTLPIAEGGTGATTASAARTSLGLGTAAVEADTKYAHRSNNLSDLASASTARTNLGLGTLATASSVNNSTWSGTDLAVTNGGTGASDAGTARSNLGLSIGSDVQAHDGGLDDIAALAVTNGNFIVGNGSAWVAESGSTARASLGLGSLATLSSINNGNWSGTDLAVANGGTGASDAGTARSNLGLGSAATEADTKYAHRSNNLSDLGSASTARSNLGLGTLATQNSIDNGDWSGTDLAVGNGGTGASNASGARSNLGIGSMATRDVTIQSGGSPSGGSDGDVYLIY